MKMSLAKDQIAALENEEEAAREIKGLKDDLFKLRQCCFDSAFIATARGLMRLTN
jgi:hypothetical protein